eukprot:CAMPEP_0184536628 /NCGR_PEP_ID=MMETSP0198_2-20121128/16548_1 /TAXON_ID=1112570 /ORGANISM="Thraustochytrium sp., Strain LLF1b" /LENGTH=307 /DNA_ID=CAMNT_0026929797 /DNA_START=5 /DNA_END=928 /DNA_ORIENTATION=+
MEEEDLGIVLSEDEELGLEIAPEAVVVAETSNDVKPETLAGLPKVDAGKVALSLDATFDCGPVPSLCKGTPCCLGVDEAGRGPVIGPMIFGAAYWPLDQSDSINKLGFNDSKQLTESDRERMFGIIDRESDKIGHVLCTLSAEHISTNMMARNPVSLNELSYLATTGMIRRVVKSGVNVAEIYVDAVGNCERYQQRLSRDFPNACVTVKPKADAIYKVVGAASIYAKVTRDRSLKSWVFREQYASDGTPLATGSPTFELLRLPRGREDREMVAGECEPYFRVPVYCKAFLEDYKESPRRMRRRVRRI